MIFNEYEYKGYEKRVNISFLRNSIERINPWEITNFVSRISTYMYKIEVLNTIALAINCGVEKKNIFVLDKAYKLNGNYRYFSTVHLNSMEINSIYSIGKPIGMEPNDELMEMKYLFEILYKVNQVLYQFGRKRINKLDRVEAYCEMTENGFLSAVEFVINKAKKKIDDEDRIKAERKLVSESEKIVKKYTGFLMNKRYFDKVDAKLNGNDIEEISDMERKIEKEYYKKFYEYIFVLPRPVVGIYEPEGRKIIILCADHFDSSINKNTKIDLKSITQNSPILGEIEAGLEILALKKDEERKELEIQKLEKENMILDTVLMEKEIAVMNAAIDLKNKLNNMADTIENTRIKAMVDSYANRQLLMVYGKVQNGYLETMRTNKFVEKSAKIIDIHI